MFETLLNAGPGNCISNAAAVVKINTLITRRYMKTSTRVLVARKPIYRRVGLAAVIAVTKLAIDLGRCREAEADHERIHCVSTLRKVLRKFLVEHPQPGSEPRNGRAIKPLPADHAAPLWQPAHVQAMKALEVSCACAGRAC